MRGPMTVSEATLVDLARQRDLRVFEDRVLAAIDAGTVPRHDLVEALAVLAQDGRTGEAITLAWAWLTAERERADPKAVLDLGRDLLLRCGTDDEMRRQVGQLYEEVYADRPEIAPLLQTSGLTGGKSVLRALRTLDLCLGLHAGSHLVSRTDEHVAEVTAIDSDLCLYTVRRAAGEDALDADALALAYDVAEPNDFRVLLQLYPERIGSMLEADPTGLVIGMLKARGGRLDAYEVEHLLSPRFIAPEQFSKWWSKARASLKRCAHIVVEGRSPVVLKYHAEGQTLEDEIEPQWAKARAAAERLAVIETYFREARARRVQPQPTMVQRMRQDLRARVALARTGSPGEALTEALIDDRLAREAGLPEAGDVAREIIAESADVVCLLGELTDPRLYVRAVEHLRSVKPDDWPNLYAALLPLASLEACPVMAKALTEGGHRDVLAEAVNRILSDLTHHIDAVCWLWRGTELEGTEPICLRELLPRLLEHLADLARSDHTPPEVLRNARHKLRAALSADGCRRYREVISAMDAGLAATVWRSIERSQGLGQVVRSRLLLTIHDIHPQLIVRKAKVDPWLDEGVIFATQEGMKRREEELNHLVNVKMQENAKAIGDAAAHGDLSENSEYRFALEERDLLRARVARIREEMGLARLLTANDVLTDQVNIGTRVTLQSLDGSLRKDMTILSLWEADLDKGIYYYRAPLCLKLKGLAVGDSVTLDLDGTERTYRIEAIANALTRT